MSSKEEVNDCIATGFVNESLVNSMAKQDIKISTNSSFKEVVPHQQWIIIDGFKIYTITKDAQKQELNVRTSLGTSQMAGYALSLRGIPAIFAGLILAFVLRTLGMYLLPSGSIIMAIGYFMLGFAPNIYIVYASMLFIGLAGGLVTSPLMLLIPKVLKTGAITLGISIVSSAALLGQFLSPIVTNGLAILFGNHSYQFKFFATGGMLLFLTIAGLIYLFFTRKQQVATN
jgi:MFS family permease